MLPEYAWSEAEPALAIICGCVVTYRPLFTGIKFDLSKVSSIFSRARSGSESTKKLYSGSSNSNMSRTHWDEKEHVDLRIPQLSAKAAKGALHVVHFNAGVSNNTPMDRFYQQPRPKHNVSESVQKPKPKYRSPPFMMEGRAPVVDPFV